MTRTSAPICLRQARREMILAIEAIDADDAHAHEQAAHDFMREAVREIRLSPDVAYDWAELNEPAPA